MRGAPERPNPPTARPWLGPVVFTATFLWGAPALAVLCDSFSLCGPTDDPCVVSRDLRCDITAASPVKTFDLGGRALLVKTGASIKVTPQSSAVDPPGGMLILAGSVHLESSAQLIAPGTTVNGTTGGEGGTIGVTTTRDIRIDVAGSKLARLDVTAKKHSGEIDLTAGGAIQIDGALDAGAYTQMGVGGKIVLVATGSIGVGSFGLVDAGGNDVGGMITCTSHADIHVDASATHAGLLRVSGSLTAGDVDLEADPGGAIRIDGVIKADAPSGFAGNVRLAATTGLTVGRTAVVDASGIAGGQVTGTTGGNILIDAVGATVGLVDVSGQDGGGTITLNAGGAGGIQVHGTLTIAGTTRAGSAGQVTLQTTAGDVVLDGAHPIDASAGDPDGGGGNVTVLSAGHVMVTGPLLASGGAGGTIGLSAEGDILTTATLDVQARGASGDDGGVVSAFARGSISIQGAVLGSGSSSIDFGGGAGAEVDLQALGNLSVSAPLYLSGGGPDGDGGTIDFYAGGDLVQTGSIAAAGTESGCGDDLTLSAGGNLTLGAINDSGGFSCGGGSVTAMAGGQLTANAEVNADTDGASIQDGGPIPGEIKLSASSIDVGGNLHASGLNGGAGGVVTLHGCLVTVEQGAHLTAAGTGGTNVLRANDHLTIAGVLVAGDGGNQLEVTGPNQLTLTGASITPPPIVNSMAQIGPCVPPTTTITSTTTSISATSTTTSSSTSTSSVQTTTTSTTNTISSTSTSSTTASSTSTSSTSTSRSTTISTSTSSSTSSTSVTTTSTSSSTSSTAPECVAGPGACDDGNACTDDVCQGGVCIHAPFTDIRSVTCRLATIESDLRTVAADQVGGVPARNRLVARIAAVHHTVDMAGAPGTRRATRIFKRADRKLKSFMTTMTKGKHSGKIQPGVADQVLMLASGARTNLLPFEKLAP